MRADYDPSAETIQIELERLDGDDVDIDGVVVGLYDGKAVLIDRPGRSPQWTAPVCSARSPVNDEAALRLEVRKGGVEAAFQLWRQAALDLNCPLAPAWPAEHQVDLGAAAGPVEARFDVAASQRGEVLDRHSLPARARHQVAEDRLLVGKAEKGVEEAAVAHVDLGRADQALAGVGQPWGSRRTSSRSTIRSR
jgi:hypothetical protein